MKKVTHLLENAVNSNFSRKVDKERITIISFLANGFGLRICMGGVFSERVRKNVRSDIFYFCGFHEMLCSGGPE